MSDQDPISETLQERVRRFEAAVSELIGEGHSILNLRALLQAAADRANVDLQEVYPTRH